MANGKKVTANKENANKIARKPLAGIPIMAALNAPLAKIITGTTKGNNTSAINTPFCCILVQKAAAKAHNRNTAGVPNSTLAIKTLRSNHDKSNNAPIIGHNNTIGATLNNHWILTLAKTNRGIETPDTNHCSITPSS